MDFAFKHFTNNQLKPIQVMVRLYIFPIFSFLAKILSFLYASGPKLERTLETVWNNIIFVNQHLVCSL